MRVFAGLMLLLLTSSLYAAEQEQEYVPRFVSFWLKQHNFNDFKIEQDKLLIEKAGLEITGAIQQVQEKEQAQDGKKFLIESRFTIKHNGKILVEEFAGSFGRTEKDAFINSLENLCHTILHPVYKMLVDPKDTHVFKETIKKDNRETTFHYAGLGVMGDQFESEKSIEMVELIIDEVSTVKVEGGIHTAKLVLAKVASQKPTVTLMIDNKPVEQQSQKFKDYEWPDTKKFYLAKFFMVITQK